MNMVTNTICDQQTELNFRNFPLIGKDELNLVDVPFSLLSNRPAAKKNSAHVKTIKVQKSYKSVQGEMKIGTIVITGSDAYGLPMPADTDLWMAILCLFKACNFDNHTIYFTRYELLTVLGWPKTKHYYDRLKAGLNRLKTVNIVFDRCWWNSVHKTYTSTAFNLIDNYEIFDERNNLGNEQSFIKLNDVVYDNCRSGHIKNLDLKFYLNLSSSISKQLYRVLDKQANNKYSYQIGIRKLAHDRLGLPTAYYVSKIKQLLQPALEELSANSFISKWAYEMDNIVFHFKQHIVEPKFNRNSSIANFLVEEFHDSKSFYFYLKVASTIPEPVLYRLVGEVKEMALTSEIQSKAKYFTQLVLNESKKLGISLQKTAVDRIVI
jgi:hypothetical protein